MANNASNYYASVGSSIMNNDGSNELSSAVDNSMKVYALNLTNQAEMNNLLDKSVNALTLNEKDANGNYTGFSKIFHDEVASDKATQIDKSAEEIKNRKMQELQNMQNSLLQEQNNLQVDGITKAVTGQNYSDFSNNLNKALEHKYSSAGGNAMSIDTIKYYIQNPNMVLEAEKAHQLAAQNGTNAQTTLTKEDIGGLKAILQDRNLITLFEKDRYIENERDRLNKGYFTPEENLQRAGMLKQVNEWAYRTNTQQQVADMLNGRVAGTMGRKQGESYEENLDRIINAKNKISLSNAIDRFGNGFPISSDINGSVGNDNNGSNGNIKNPSITQNNTNEVQQDENGVYYIDSLDDNGNIVKTSIPETAYNENDRSRLAYLNEDEQVNKANLEQMEFDFKNDPSKEMQESQKRAMMTNKDSEASKKVSETNATHLLISGSSDSVGQAIDRTIDGGIDFIKDMGQGYIPQKIKDNGGILAITAGGGWLMYEIFKEKHPDAKIDITPEQAQKMSAKEFSDFVAKKGIDMKQAEAEVDAILNEFKKNAKNAYNEGKLTRQEYDRIMSPEAYDDKDIRREAQEEFKKRYNREPSAKELKDATEAKKKGFADKVKGVWNNMADSKFGKWAKNKTTKGKIIAKKGVKIGGTVATVAGESLLTAAEIYDQSKGYMLYKDLNRAGVDNPEQQLHRAQEIYNKIQNSEVDVNKGVAYNNVTNEELDELEKILIAGKNANQKGFGIGDALSPIESITRKFKGNNDDIAKYDALLNQIKEIREIKEINSTTVQYGVNTIKENLKAIEDERNSILNNNANLTVFKDAENKKYEQARNAKTLEEEVKLKQEGFEYGKIYDRTNKAQVDKSRAELSAVFGYNTSTPAGQANESLILGLLSNATNNTTKNSAVAKSAISGIKIDDINKVNGSGAIFFTGLIQGEFSDKNGQFIKSHIGDEGENNFIIPINDTINDLSKAFGSNDIRGAFSSAGNLHSKFKKFVDTLKNEKFANGITFTHMEKQRLNNEAKSIKDDNLVISYLGNSVKNLDALGMWGLKVAIYYRNNPNADFSDAKTIREITNLDVKKEIKNRVENAKLNK